MNHDDTMIKINAMLDNAEPPFSAAYYCIYKVPFVTRNHNEYAYTPKVISIGPFHHRHYQHRPHLENMERHKLIFFKSFLQRATALELTQTLIYYIDSIIPAFRRCYSETLDITDQELVNLILIDSGFIIELFYGYHYNNLNDYHLLKPWLDYHIRLDLSLLENQLPFFILENIFNISFRNEPNILPFLKLTFEYFNYFNESKLVCNNSVRIMHFTDLIRIFHLQHSLERRPPRTHATVKHVYSVTELLEAGVKFKVNTESECLLDLRFLGSVLEIPQLRVNDCTEILFRNIVALEQCHYPETSYITDYVVVLNFLMNTGRDVDILVQNGILVNWLGNSDSVANLFNSLWKNVIHADVGSHYYFLCEDLNGFYRDPWHKLKATLTRDYCSTPWKTAASVAGVLLLFLSLLQSVCSVLQIV